MVLESMAKATADKAIQDMQAQYNQHEAANSYAEWVGDNNANEQCATEQRRQHCGLAVASPGATHGQTAGQYETQDFRDIEWAGEDVDLQFATGIEFWGEECVVGEADQRRMETQGTGIWNSLVMCAAESDRHGLPSSGSLACTAPNWRPVSVRERSALRRARQSPDTVEKRKESDRLRTARRRAASSEEQVMRRRAADRERIARKRAAIKDGDSEERRIAADAQRERVALARANETPEEQARRRETNRERVARKRAEASAEEMERERTANRERSARKRAEETPEERERRRALSSEYASRRRRRETAEEAAQRKATQRARMARKRAEQTGGNGGGRQRSARDSDEKQRYWDTQSSACSSKTVVVTASDEESQEGACDARWWPQLPVDDLIDNDSCPAPIDLKTINVHLNNSRTAEKGAQKSAGFERHSSNSRLSNAIKHVWQQCPPVNETLHFLQRRYCALRLHRVTCMLPESHDMAMARHSPVGSVDDSEPHLANTQLLYLLRLCDAVPVDGISGTALPVEQRQFHGLRPPDMKSLLSLLPSASAEMLTATRIALEDKADTAQCAGYTDQPLSNAPPTTSTTPAGQNAMSNMQA